MLRVQYVSDLLVSKAAMLGEYFSIDISPDGALIAIPELLPHYVPALVELPLFLLKLASDVSRTERRQLFHVFCASG